jgi:NAD(P)-dependent dehydrogenase (short-subunit alcohol dehydrogenase family)
MTQGRVQKKVALVTGAAQGIGKETAIVLAREGAIVVVSDINDSLGQTVCEEIGGSCIYLHLDVSHEDDWKQAISTITKRFGNLNILVNNAGVTGFQEGFGPQDPENASLDSWRKVHAVNSDGTFLGCKYAIQAMKLSDDGSIINISLIKK